MLRLAVFISGTGSNLRAIQDNIENGYLDAKIVLVVSNKANAGGLIFAQEKNLETLISQDESQIIAKLQLLSIDLICLAGYLKIISSEFIRAFPRKIINIHPSLLPSFPGLNAQQQAIDYGVKYSGCTVHFVDEGAVDSGTVILQACVPVSDDDDAQSLATKILREEHRIYSEAIRLIDQKRLLITGRRIKIKN